MNRNRKPFFALFLRVLTWNLGVSAVVGSLFWWFEGDGAPREIWAYCQVALVYANTYGFLMGLTMPYLGERIDALRGALAWTLMVAALLVLTALASLIVGAIFVAIRFYQWDMFWPRFVINWVISLIIGFSITLYQGFRGEIDRTKLKLRTQELEKERALKLASEAQLASLQSRLQPHFLFNTLNSISALIQENPERADLMLQRLAALLRFSLDAGTRRLVPLPMEMKIVADYLDIEKERLGERLKYALDVPAELNHIQVPPLSVQTLVENSLKHGVSPLRAAGKSASPRGQRTEACASKCGTAVRASTLKRSRRATAWTTCRPAWQPCSATPASFLSSRKTTVRSLPLPFQ